jgi:PAS domain S-box-containing protein
MTGPAIFIVEDELIVASDIKDTLAGLGYDIKGIAKSGEIALEKISETRPDLVLMDIHLTGAMDGIEVAEKIHALFNIPVIYLTAFADKNLVERAEKTNPSGYLLKPFNERQIQIAIEIALNNFALQQQLEEHDATINTLINVTANPLMLIDRQGLIRVVNGGVAKNAEKTPEQLTGTPFMDLMPGGYITTRLREAVQQAVSGKGSRFEEEQNGVVYDNAIIPVMDSCGAVKSIAVSCTDITHLKGAEMQLKAANDQLVTERNRLAILTAALDSMDDPVIITDPPGTITYVNDVFTKRFGYSLQEVKGKHMDTLAAPENLFIRHTEGFISDQKSVWTGKFIARNKYGLNLSFLLKGSPVFEEKRLKNRVFVLREEFLGKQ